MTGAFIVLEGGEGAGKSTQTRLLAAALRRRYGQVVVETRESGGTYLGEQLRALIMSGRGCGMSARAEALLFAADRAQHVEEVVKPALAAGAVVVSDRYEASSIAYQGAGRKVGEDEIGRLSAWATGLRPTLTVLLDVPPQVGLARARDRGDTDRFEQELRSFHGRVRASYLRQARDAGQAWVTVRATGDVDQVAAAVEKAVVDALALTPSAGVA